MPDHRRCRAGAHGVSRGCAPQWAPRRRVRAASADHPRCRANRRGVRHRGGRHRVRDRRSRWPSLLLRHQCAIQLRRRRAAGRGVRSIRASGGFPRAGKGGPLMRFGFWMPVFGGGLRNVEDEGMPATFAYQRELAQQADRTGWDVTLIAELNLNDIKGPEADWLETWTTAAARAPPPRPPRHTDTG